jgi:hypothetical protein
VSTGTPLPTLPPASATASGDRAQHRATVSKARTLTYVGLGWHVFEAAVAIGAGLIAGSVALIGFGGDSMIEAGAGLVVLWLVTGGRVSLGHAERRAQQLIAASFVLLALYHDRVGS